MEHRKERKKSSYNFFVNVRRKSMICFFFTLFVNGFNNEARSQFPASNQIYYYQLEHSTGEVYTYYPEIGGVEYVMDVFICIFDGKYIYYYDNTLRGLIDDKNGYNSKSPKGYTYSALMEKKRNAMNCKNGAVGRNGIIVSGECAMYHVDFSDNAKKTYQMGYYDRGVFCSREAMFTFTPNRDKLVIWNPRNPKHKRVYKRVNSIDVLFKAALQNLTDDLLN